MTQNNTILKHLQEYGSITPMDAVMRYGIMRLSARVHDLRESGHNITTTINRTKDGKTYAVYTLQKEGD